MVIFKNFEFGEFLIFQLITLFSVFRYLDEAGNTFLLIFNCSTNIKNKLDQTYNNCLSDRLES